MNVLILVKEFLPMMQRIAYSECVCIEKKKDVSYLTIRKYI